MASQAVRDKVNTIINKLNNFLYTEAFNNILERLTKIDEAQKKIDSLSSEIVGLQSVLTDKKTRGIFGEVNLNYILTSVFGERKGKIYDIQHTMSNGSVADSILFAPEPLGTICIDSKFPLENFEKMTDKTLSVAERDVAPHLIAVITQEGIFFVIGTERHGKNLAALMMSERPEIIFVVLQDFAQISPECAENGQQQQADTFALHYKISSLNFLPC